MLDNKYLWKLTEHIDDNSLDVVFQQLWMRYFLHGSLSTRPRVNFKICHGNTRGTLECREALFMLNVKTLLIYGQA